MDIDWSDEDPLAADIEIQPPRRYRFCPDCGGGLVLRHGRYGPFYGCENFPKCKFTCDEEEYDEKP